MYRPAMETFTDIINAFGLAGGDPATIALAGAIGEEPGTVRVWRHRNTLPNRVWKKTVEAAAQRGIAGVTLEALAEIAARQGEKASPPTEAAA